MFKAFLFDMDGTLVDTFELIHSSFNKVLQKYGKRTLSEKEFKEKIFGKPVSTEIAEFVGANQAEMKHILDEFGVVWLNEIKNIRVFRGSFLTLEQLRQRHKKIAVVSTSPREVVEKTLKEANIRDFIDVIVAEEDVTYKKPHHEPVVTALGRLGVRAQEALMIGDTSYDIQAGSRAGCKTALVLNGNNKDTLRMCEPDFVVENIEEVLQLA